MIVSDINGFDYRINFTYGESAAQLRTTTCVIEKVSKGGRFRDNGSTVASGQAVCDTRDRFDRAVGRKIALTRALEPIDKNTRKQLWQGFFSKVTRI